MTKNQKIILGVIAGGIVLYFVWKKFSPKKVESDNLTNEEKIIYIIENVPSGYNSFEPEHPTEDIVQRDYWLVLMKRMTNREIDLIYRVIKAKKNNTSITTEEISNKLGIPFAKRKQLENKMRGLITAIQHAKKDANWNEFWVSKRESLIESHQDKGRSSQALGRVLGSKEERRGEREERKENRKDKKEQRGGGLLIGKREERKENRKDKKEQRGGGLLMGKNG
jgi:hypothetical protein